MNPIQRYLQLTPEQKSMLRTKRIEGERTMEEWTTLLQRLFEYDQSGGRARKLSLVAGIGGAAAALAFPPLWLVPAASAAVFFTTRKLDVDDAARDAALQLLAAIRSDVLPEQPVRLRLDLRGETEDKKSADLPVRQEGAYQVVDSTFADPWAEGSTRLADGARLSWRVTSVLRRRRKTRGARAKVKEKKQQRVDVRLAFPNKRYLAVAPAPAAAPGERVSLAPGARKLTVKLQSTSIADRFQPRQLTALIARGFEHVTSSKEVRP